MRNKYKVTLEGDGPEAMFTSRTLDRMLQDDAPVMEECEEDPAGEAYANEPGYAVAAICKEEDAEKAKKQRRAGRSKKKIKTEEILQLDPEKIRYLQKDLGEDYEELWLREGGTYDTSRLKTQVHVLGEILKILDLLGKGDLGAAEAAEMLEGLWRVERVDPDPAALVSVDHEADFNKWYGSLMAGSYKQALEELSRELEACRKKEK